MGKRAIVARLMADPRYPQHLRKYLESPPDPAHLAAADYAALPVEERARRYALLMVSCDEDLDE